MEATRELKGFLKVGLLPGEEKEVSFLLDYRSFAYYEPKIHDWFVEGNDYVIEVGSSSHDIRLSGIVTVQATKELPFYYTELSPIGSLQKTAKGRKLWEQMLSQMQEAQAGQQASMEEGTLGEGSGQLMQNMMLEMPIGALVGFGSISKEQLKGMLGMLNS